MTLEEHFIQRLAAEQPWLGVTAFLGEYPHLVIGKEGDTFILEDESGNIRQIDYTFNWEEPKVETNRLVAASRADITDADAPRLGYDTEEDFWYVYADDSGSSSTGLDLGGMGVSGPATHEHPGAGHNEPTIEVRASCPHCHSDQHLELMQDEHGPHSDERKFACHNCGKWSFEHELEVSNHDKDGQDKNPEGVDYEDHDDDAERHQDPLEEKEIHNDKHHFDENEDEESSHFPKKKHSSSSFHAHGFPAAGAEIVQGTAINLDKTSETEAEGIIGQLPSPLDAERDYVNKKNVEHDTSLPMFDNPFVNRGGSIREADALTLPSPMGIPEPGSFNFANSFILIKRFFNPDDVRLVSRPSCKGVLSSEGGTTSHIQVVARGMGKVSLITQAEVIDQINTGDKVILDPNTGEISVNGARGSYTRPEKFTDIIADEPIYRFVWANGHGYSEKMTNQMVGDKGGHFGMMDMLAKEGRWSYEDMNHIGMPNGLCYGFFCSNGTIIQDINTQHVDEQHFLQWAHQEEESLGLPPGQIKFKDISQNMGGGSPSMEEPSAQPDQQIEAKVAAVFEMPYPGGQGIHNGTSAAFANAGIHATITAPGAPSPITLPFSAPNMFIMAKMFQSQGFFVPGQPIQVDSDNPELAQQIIQQQSGVAGKLAYEEQGDNDHAYTDKMDDARVCSHCGSHTISTLSFDDDNDDAEFLCHTCGNTFKAKYRKSAAAKHPKGTRVQMTHPTKKGIKGSVVDHAGTDDNFGDDLYDLMLDNGDELKKVPSIHFNKIKSASIVIIAALHDEVAEYAAMIAHATDRDPDDIAADLADKGMIHSDQEWDEVIQVINHERGLNPNQLNSPSQAYSSVKEADMPQMTPAAQPDPTQNQSTGMQTPNCPHCGGPTQGTPSYYFCPSCGWNSMQGTNQAQNPGANPTFHSSVHEALLEKVYIKSSALSVGEWYTMFSPDYKVPDVIQVVEINDHGVTANIEGDDKGLFPITLPHDEIEASGYKFEPYSNPSEVKTAKIARRQFTVKEQQDLINENLEGRARNYHKINLEGTHYPQGVEASVDPLNEDFWLL